MTVPETERATYLGTSKDGSSHQAMLFVLSSEMKHQNVMIEKVTEKKRKMVSINKQKSEQRRLNNRCISKT